MSLFIIFIGIYKVDDPILETLPSSFVPNNISSFDQTLELKL